jgi:hypothetical protein
LDQSTEKGVNTGLNQTRSLANLMTPGVSKSLTRSGANMLRVTEHTAILADAHGAKSPGPRINILKEVPVNCLIMMNAEASSG